MCLLSCGGCSWLALSPPADAGTWVSSSILSGFAIIPRPASGSLPNEDCVGTSSRGLPILRSTCAHAIQHTSTTDPLSPPGLGLGGVTAGIDRETDSGRPDASRVCGSQVDLWTAAPNHGRRWLGTMLEPLSGGTQLRRSVATNRAGGGWNDRGETARRGGVLPAGEGGPAVEVARGREPLQPRPGAWPSTTSRDTRLSRVRRGLDAGPSAASKVPPRCRGRRPTGHTGGAASVADVSR